jgi:hypothetical protein
MLHWFPQRVFLLSREPEAALPAIARIPTVFLAMKLSIARVAEDFRNQ